MNKLWFLAATLVLAACSDSPQPVPVPERPPEPLTGRQAFQQTYPLARLWASDCEPIRIRSMNLKNPASANGKAGAWEITYVSQSKARSRVFTWSAVEAEGLTKGVFGGREEAWSGPSGQERPFSTAAIKIDTPDALKTATAKIANEMKKSDEHPMVNFVLESTPRFPDPAWRIYWGQSISAAEWTVFVDATAGEYLGR